MQSEKNQACAVIVIRVEPQESHMNLIDVLDDVAQKNEWPSTSIYKDRNEFDSTTRLWTPNPSVDLLVCTTNLPKDRVQQLIASKNYDALNKSIQSIDNANIHTCIIPSTKERVELHHGNATVTSSNGQSRTMAIRDLPRHVLDAVNDMKNNVNNAVPVEYNSQRKGFDTVIHPPAGPAPTMADQMASKYQQVAAAASSSAAESTAPKPPTGLKK